MKFHRMTTRSTGFDLRKGCSIGAKSGAVVCRLKGLILDFCVQRQHSRPHQFWAGATVHCSLQHLEAVDFPFGLSVAPREFDCIFYGINIPAQNASESHDRREFGINGIVDPFIQCLRIPATLDAVEAHGQAPHFGEELSNTVSRH
ncbi:hypothetical protein ABIA24_004450 [Sinorhizobium fredii]